MYRTRRTRMLPTAITMAAVCISLIMIVERASAFLTSLNTVPTKANIDMRRFTTPIRNDYYQERRRVESTRLHLKLDLNLGDDEDEINSDFYNPENIQPGDEVEVIADSKFYSIPKTPKEGVNPKGFKGVVASLKFTAKNGVECSANRPVVVKFTSPYKFQGHFEFRELKKVSQ